jgi:hypothetical protein
MIMRRSCSVMKCGASWSGTMLDCGARVAVEAPVFWKFDPFDPFDPFGSLELTWK